LKLFSEDNDMTGIIRSATLFAVCALLFATMNSAHAAPMATTDDLKNAVALLRTYQDEVGRLRELVRKPLGPYQIATQCTWCSSRPWWAFGACTEETTQRIGMSVDFSWTRVRLDQVLQQAAQSANDFSRSYAPTQAWIDGLPEFSSKFNGNADRILTVQQEIRAGNGPTNQQRQVVTGALQSLLQDLGHSSVQLQEGTRALTAFLQRQSDYRQSIKQAIAGSEQSANEQLSKLQQDAVAKAHPDCLANLVNNHFNPIRAQFDSSSQAIAASFQKLEVSSGEAEKGIAILLGAVVNNQTDLKSVMDLVNAASNDQMGSFLERLHLSAAKTQWAALAAGL
jgi:hypothetical protein